MRRGENIYKRKDKRWEGRYPVGKKPNGKTKYRSVYGKTLQEVRQKLYPLKAKYQMIQQTQGTACLTFQEWGFQWLRSVQDEVKASTFANYEHKLTHYVLSVIGHYALNELDEEIGVELLDSLKQRGLKPSTIQVIFRITNQCMREAVRKELVKMTPFSAVKLPKVVPTKDQALTKQEQKKLEKAASTESHGRGLPVLLALHAGLRIGEAAALAWSDVDFAKKMIHVKATFQRIQGVWDNKKTSLVYSSSKTTASIRSIPMSKTLEKALLQHKATAAGPFVLSEKETPSEPRLLTYHFHKIRKKAGLEQVHYHQLRHTFATRCIETNADIPSLSCLMGHSSVKLTLDTYTGSLMEQRVQVVNQMEAAVR